MFEVFIMKLKFTLFRQSPEKAMLTSIKAMITINFGIIMNCFYSHHFDSYLINLFFPHIWFGARSTTHRHIVEFTSQSHHDHVFIRMINSIVKFQVFNPWRILFRKKYPKMNHIFLFPFFKNSWFAFVSNTRIEHKYKLIWLNGNIDPYANHISYKLETHPIVRMLRA